MSRQTYTYGPVLSRRLGYSLGIDLVPYKTCNLDCIYCERGRTTVLTEDRRTYVDFEDIIQEIRSINHPIDYLTLTGNGEPLLHLNINVLIHRLKTEFKLPVVLITNALLLRYKKVRKEVLECDLILPSVDAVSTEAMHRVNRPVNSLTGEQIVRGLEQLRSEFSGQIWLEILLCDGVNTSDQEIQKLDRAAGRIKPDRVQLNTVVRPPAESAAKSVSIERLKDIATRLHHEHIEILPVTPHEKKGVDLSETELIQYLTYRPASFEELSGLFSGSLKQIRELLSDLETRGKIRRDVFDHTVFFRAD